MIYEFGECLFESANDANIPVDIWLLPLTDERKEELELGGDCEHSINDFKWVLTAANYMPRKARICPETYKVVASTREELTELVKKYVKPLYMVANSRIDSIIENKNDSLYYWNNNKD